MSTISNKEATLMGLLYEKPRYAYEIELEINNRSMDYWTEISQSSIYKLLRKLEKRNMLKSEINLSEKNIAQKVYSLTSSGKAKFKEKIKEVISEWIPSIHPIDVGLANLYVLNKEDAIECLKKYIKSLDETIKGYGELEEFLISKKCTLGNLQLATRRIYILKGEKKWLMTFLEEYKNE
ncbi:MAG: PadR family transcriptional regulator [Candidatus Hermodarchaeota archaeon]